MEDWAEAVTDMQQRLRDDGLRLRGLTPHQQLLVRSALDKGVSAEYHVQLFAEWSTVFGTPTSPLQQRSGAAPVGTRHVSVVFR